MSEDSFLREVDEAVRQERYKRLWDRYGLYVIALAVVIVVGVSGYKGWNYWQNQRAAEAGARFVGALTLREEGKNEDALTAFRELAEDGPSGYRILSRFQLAAADAEAGRKEEAVETYDALAADSGVSRILRDYAQVQAAALLVDEADLEAMKERIGDLAESNRAYRHSAREFLGLVAYRVGNTSEAERYFTRALTDPGIPGNLRSRAEMMLALVVKADAPAEGAEAPSADGVDTPSAEGSMSSVTN